MLLLGDVTPHVLFRHTAKLMKVVDECMEPGSPNGGNEPFRVLDTRSDIDREFRSGATRFIISYDLAVRQQSILIAYLARNSVHLVLDESHRIILLTAQS